MNQHQPHTNVSFEDRQTMNSFINSNKANPFITRIEPVRDSKDTLQVSFRDEYSKTQFESTLGESMLSEKEFKPHMMYDPKTGKGYKAEKEADHLRMQKMGYGHKKPDVKNETRFDPSKNPTAKTDKEFDGGRDALRKAGIPHMGQRAIGSMNRERNKLRVHPKFEKKARQALKKFPKIDLEINDKMPEKPMIRSGKGSHDCASKVEHSEWGVGSCIREQHAAPDTEGNIAWYDVMFEHGLEKQVCTDDLNILMSEMHENHDHDEGEELDEKVSSVKKSDAPFTLVAIKGGKTVGQIRDIGHGELSDAIKFMKTDNKGAKISVEAKGGKVVHTESVDEDVQIDEATKKQNGEKARKVLTSAKVPHDMVMGTIRVPERFVRIAKKKLDDAFGGMFQKKTGFKVSGTMKEDVEQVDEMSAKAHYNKMKAQGKVGRGGRVVTPIDRNRFPNREREGLEGPFRNRKTSLVYYYDKKAGKYYDPQSDMYLAVKDIMDSVEEGLRQAMTDQEPRRKADRKRKEKDNFDLYKKKQGRVSALRGDKSSRRLTPGQEKHYRQTVNLSQIKALSGVKKEGVEEAVKYPHNMYDPKTGKRYVAKNRQDHMRMSRMGYDHVPKAMNKSTMKEANDPHMVTELYLYITNDANLHRQMIQPLIKNYRRKLQKQSYDETLAIKGFVNVVNAGIKSYAKDFSVGERLKVSKADRQEVAKKLSLFFRDEIMQGY